MMSRSSFSGRRSFGLLLLLLVAVLGFLFHQSFSPPFVLFASDGPLGHIYSQWEWASQMFRGFWQDLNWIGSESPAPAPSITIALYALLGPVGFLKFYPPLTLVILGISVWFCCRQLHFAGAVSILAGLAAALNTHPFSFACWGLGSLPLSFAMAFFAMGLLASSRRTWLHIVLAGFCVGMGVVEGFDNGAILSLYVSAWVVFLWYHAGTEKAKQLGKAAVCVAIIAVSAALLATHILYSLVTTQIKGVSGAQQDAQTKEQRWDWATQWSFPKAETLRVIIPGLYGYRMDTPEGGQYWGTVGRQPGWETHRQGFPRHSGAGEYAGVLVCLLALFSVACAIGKSKMLTAEERRMVWFWVGVALISLLLSFGRHAPFYQVLYSLPYFSTIRNPIKFMLPVQMALLFLFAIGLQCLYRRYEQAAVQATKSASNALSAWWKSAALHERRYAQGLIALGALFFIGYLIYYSSAQDVRRYLSNNGFGEADATAIHRFSLAEVRWTILFFLGSAAVIVLALAGWFTGPRWKWLTVAFGLILTIDLGRANAPWIVYYDYKDRYEESSLLATLKERAHERRVTNKFHPLGSFLSGPQSQVLNGIYNEWLQHQFQYYRIHSLDISQMPRIPQLDQDFFNAFMPKDESQLPRAKRLWELTNTRWILAEKGFLPYFAQTMGAGPDAFRIHSDFNFILKPGRTRAASFDDIKAEISTGSTNSPFAIIEFTGALPRTKFYTSWVVMTNDSAALAELASPAFDPHARVIVSSPAPLPVSTNAEAPGTNSIQVLSYQPRQWKLQVENRAPGILLLNDKFDDDWTVTVNGQQQTLLRCNYLMRGVFLEPGKHTVVFSYRVPQRGIYLSLASIVVAILISGYLGFFAYRKQQQAPPQNPARK